MNTIPDLTGAICESLVRQVCWYEGEKSEGVHLLFLKIAGGKWHRFFFDCGPLFWREVEAPDAWDTTRADKHYYEQTEIGREHGLIGIAIAEVVHQDLVPQPEVVIRFQNGTRLVLQDFCEYQTLRSEKTF